MTTILDSITDLLKDCVEKNRDGIPDPPDSLVAIEGKLVDLTNITADLSGDGIDRWVSKLRSIVSDTEVRESLVVRAMQVRFPRLAESLTLLNIVQFRFDGAGKLRAFGIDWTQLNNLMSNPGPTALTLLASRLQGINDAKALQVLILMLLSAPQALLELEYSGNGFGSLPLDETPGVSSDALKQLITNLVNSPVSIALPMVLDSPSLTEFANRAGVKPPPPLDYIKLDVLPGWTAAKPLDGISALVRLQNPSASAHKTVDLGDGWQLAIAAAGAVPTGYRIAFSGGEVDTSGDHGELSVLAGTAPADADAMLIGEKDGTHFSIRSVNLGVHFRPTGPLFSAELNLETIEFVLKPDFLSFLDFGLDIPTELRFSSSINLEYAQGRGLTGNLAASTGGPAGLSTQFTVPLDLKVGGAGAGLEVDAVVVQLDVALVDGDLRFRVSLRYNVAAQIGPLSAIMDGAGVWIGRWTNGNGGLLAPHGIGITLKAGPIDGGGFLDIVSDHEFAGGLHIKILGIGAFAYGLYSTLPSGDPSVVALIGIRLPIPGVQLGFGFAISGFGGLVGINRRADTDLLRERLASGAAGDTLFNDDPMKNAPKLLGDLKAFFPSENGIFIIGPTLQINWLLILKLDVGIFIELPGPRKIFLAGSARLVIGSEEFALVYLRLDFVGGVDLTKSLIFFDAVLVNSQVLGIFTITGGVALRISYGAAGYFLFSVGGFHPSFNPGSMELPKVARVGVSVSLGPVWLKQEMYLAITSNTFQIGSRVEAGLEIGPIAAHGWFAFDALVQFKPLYFVGTVDAGFDVEVEGVSLCSVRVQGRLTGPGPLTLEARASVHLLFVKVSGHVTLELNSNPPENPVTIPDLPDHLKGELANPDNLRMEGEDAAVVFGPSTTSGITLFSAAGTLVWEQRRAPLKLAMQKVEGIALDGFHTLTISSGVAADTDEKDWFSVGTYLQLSDSDALNNARFCEQVSGLRINPGAFVFGPEVPAAVTLQLIKVPSPIPVNAAFGMYLSASASGTLGERHTGAALAPGPAAVNVVEDHWDARDATGTVTNSVPLNSVQAFVTARQTGGVAVATTDRSLDLSGVI